jgi:hypothetical protein
MGSVFGVRCSVFGVFGVRYSVLFGIFAYVCGSRHAKKGGNEIFECDISVLVSDETFSVTGSEAAKRKRSDQHTGPGINRKQNLKVSSLLCAS